MRLASSSPLPGAGARALPRARRISLRAPSSPASASSGKDPGRARGSGHGELRDGIGLHTACRLASSGHAVIAHGRDAPASTPRPLASTPRPARRRRRRVIVRDFASLDDVRGLARDVLDHHPALHLLANNAGVFASGAERLRLPGRMARAHVSGERPRTLPPHRPTPPRILGDRGAGVDDVVLRTSRASPRPRASTSTTSTRTQKATPTTGVRHSKRRMMRAFSFAPRARRRAAARPNHLTERGAPLYRAVSVLTCDPGTVNTKMLLAGWGPCGIGTYEAPTSSRCSSPMRTSSPRERRAVAPPRTASTSRAGGGRTAGLGGGEGGSRRLWRVLEEATGLTYAPEVRARRASERG